MTHKQLVHQNYTNFINLLKEMKSHGGKIKDISYSEHLKGWAIEFTSGEIENVGLFENVAKRVYFESLEGFVIPLQWTGIFAKTHYGIYRVLLKNPTKKDDGFYIMLDSGREAGLYWRSGYSSDLSDLMKEAGDFHKEVVLSFLKTPNR